MRYVCAFFVLVLVCAAQTSTLSGNAEWTAAPGFVRQSQGKYPASTNVVLFKNDCRDKSGNVVKPLAKGSTYTIFPTGTGVTAVTPTIGECTLTTTLSIDTSAQPGLQFLMVNEAPSKDATASSAGGAIFAMMDATAGPTPSTPEVDVMWDVLSKHVCSDSFGNHVPRYLYCVEVKIGNNSSHGLQLAGVGFKVRNPYAGLGGIAPDATLISANTAYQTTRSMAQAGGDTTFRNLAYRSLEGTGLIMASFTPFFKNTNHKANWSTASSIVGNTLTQVFSLVAPDQTVRELTNLDDQAFRDGKIIPNNTQIRMIVFVDKELIKGTIQQRCKTLFAPASTDGKAGSPPSPEVLSKCENSDDPTIVKLLLGDLVVVGDKIDYIERMVVDTSVTSQEVNAPMSATATVDPTSKTVTMVGASLKGVSVTSKEGTALPLTYQDATKVQFQAPTGADVSKGFDVMVKSADGKQTQTVSVPAAPATPAATTPPQK